MARIRIVDEWLRSPSQAGSVRARSVMIVADTWAEQRVLMRAYAECVDQLRPSIVLHGSALAIGPAGTDPHGAWGVHVDTHDDGRAQQLREALEESARRLAGSKGTPPRLADEQPAFDRKPTNQWAPGSRRDRHSQAPIDPTPAEPPGSAPATVVQGSMEDELDARVTGTFRAVAAPPAPAPAPVVAAPPAPLPRRAAAPTPVPRPAPVYTAGPDARTIMPFGPQSFQGAPPPAVAQQHQGWTPPRNATPRRSRRTSYPRALTPPPTTGALGKVVGRTMPLGFSLAAPEREVLNRIGTQGALAARDVAAIAGVDDGVAWMETLMAKLANHGLDIVAPGDDRDGEPTYVLRT